MGKKTTSALNEWFQIELRKMEVAQSYFGAETYWSMLHVVRKKHMRISQIKFVNEGCCDTQSLCQT